MKKHVIYTKGASLTSGMLSRAFVIEDGKTPSPTDMEGFGKTVEESMGALVLNHGSKIPELQEFREQFKMSGFTNAQIVGGELMKTARQSPGMVISIDIDTTCNWPKEDAVA